MGKKRQPDAGVRESTDSSAEDDSKGSEIINCPHIHKSIQLTAVKKALRDGGLSKGCAECLRAKSQSPNENDCSGQYSSNDIFNICLKCGHNGCTTADIVHDRKHATNHITDPHDLAIDVQLSTIWCYKCDKQIPESSSKKLLECIEYMRKYRKTTCEVKVQEKLIENGPIALPYIVTPPSTSSPSVEVIADNGLLPRVRGLANLGNTCFFNAVLQCLAQTPYLLSVLKEMQRHGERFRLPGGEVRLSNETVHLNPLEGNLREIGPNTLTHALIDVLSELRSGTHDVLVPKKLRELLHEKCPQFAGYAEHDSHELLRQLLETVRTEDLHRYKTGILDAMHLSTKTDREQMTDEQRAHVRAYGRQAGDLLLKPAAVFQGELISLLECQQCQHTTEHIESFLDLSLPVVADKPVHVRRRISISSEQDYYANSAITNSGLAEAAATTPPSKYQLKKDRRKAKRGQGRNRRILRNKFTSSNNNNNEGDNENDDGGDICNNNGLEDDANQEELDDEDQEEDNTSDVAAEGDDEDEANDDNKSPAGRSEEVAESGYSSERPGNGDSACGSPNGGESPPSPPPLLNDETTASARLSPTSIPPHLSSHVTLAPRIHCPSNECTLLSCLNQFTAQELLTGNNKVGCDVCTRNSYTSENLQNDKVRPTVYTNASKQLLVVGPPAVLILHLKRFQVLRFTSRKNSEDVKFPAVLDLAPYCTIKSRTMPTVNPNQTIVRYALYGIVQHSGSMHGGHYVAYVKVRAGISSEDQQQRFLPKISPSTTQPETPLPTNNISNVLEENNDELPEPPDGKWYYVSDSHVTETREAHVLNSEAYLLFYERIY